MLGMEKRYSHQIGPSSNGMGLHRLQGKVLLRPDRDSGHCGACTEGDVRMARLRNFRWREVKRGRMNRESTEQIALVVSQIQTEVNALRVMNAQNLRTLRRQFSKLIARASPEVVVGIGMRLIDTPGFAYRFLAYELLLKHKAALSSLGPKDVLRLARGLDNWGAVD